MSQIPQYSYTWSNPYGSLVFEFTIPGTSPVTPPTSMTLKLYSKEDPGNVIVLESSEGEIVISGKNINDNLLEGKIWLNSSSPDHGFVLADLSFGQSPSRQSLGGALVEYRF